MKIEIPDNEVDAILTGLRAGDSTVTSRLADLLHEARAWRNAYPFAVSLDGEHFGNFSSLEAIKEEFDEIVQRRIQVYDRVHGIDLSNSQVWQD